MPQKTVFTKFPLLSVPHGFLSCGLVRSDDDVIRRLYSSVQVFLESPCVWEGAFRLAAILKDDPLSEPVTEKIISGMSKNEDGSFEGRIEEQIQVARAGLALFEYNTDREILRRIASWCRYLEIEWDRLFSAGRTVFCPADLMELLVRFYQASGIRSILRLCTKLRSSAFDWTTSLHTIQQVIALENTDEDQISFVDRISTGDLDYDQKQILLNHAVMLADGIRYSLYSGLFSGNRQDLTAGKTAWNFLQKHYRAICGGTTSGPFLCGAASNASVGTEALSAWTEAFASQMLLPGSDWAVDELIRTVCNGLASCLKTEKLMTQQRVNCIAQHKETEASASVYSRFIRAVASAFSHGISLTESGFRINYPMKARYIIMIRKQPVVLHSDGQKIILSMKEDMSFPVAIFSSGTETAAVSFVNSNGRTVLSDEAEEERNGHYLHTERTWRSLDQICFEQGDKVIVERTHHQGVCWFIRNRLMVFACESDSFRVAAAEKPIIADGQVQARLYRIENWHTHHDEPDDIPVLPGHILETTVAGLIPYDCAEKRISMFPRINPSCLK